VHRTAIHADYFKKIRVTNVAFCDVAFLTIKILFSCGMYKCKFIYACRKITASHASLFKKFSDLNSILCIVNIQIIVQKYMIKSLGGTFYLQIKCSIIYFYTIICILIVLLL